MFKTSKMPLEFVSSNDFKTINLHVGLVFPKGSINQSTHYSLEIKTKNCFTALKIHCSSV